MRLFRWRNYRDYGTGVAGDLFVHLFSGMHFITGAIGPTRVYATGGLRFWKDGRDVPDVMIALYDYPTFNVMLRVNFVDGASETSGLRFIGSEGIMTVEDGVTLSKVPRELEPGHTIDTFPKAQQEQFLKEYRQKYPARPKVNTGQMSAEENFCRREGPPRVRHSQHCIPGVRARPAGGGRRGLRIPRRRSGAAVQHQLFRQESLPVGRRGDEAEGVVIRLGIKANSPQRR